MSWGLWPSEAEGSGDPAWTPEGPSLSAAREITDCVAVGKGPPYRAAAGYASYTAMS